MSAICIIPARGGSVRIPRKNIKLFHGKPIIAYSIEAAKRSRLFDAVFVSTDDAEISGIARTYGAEVIMREPCDGTLGTLEVTRRTFLAQTHAADFVCCIYATAPMLSEMDLHRGLVQANKEFNHAIGVGTDPLRDAGQFYWSRSSAVLCGYPLIDTTTAMIPIDERRVCDINTIEDFERAEKMYEALHA